MVDCKVRFEVEVVFFEKVVNIVKKSCRKRLRSYICVMWLGGLLPGASSLPTTWWAMNVRLSSRAVCRMMSCMI
eukprot:4586923-Amphidinium_carterae.1